MHNFPEGMAVFLGSIKVKDHDEQTKIQRACQRINTILCLLDSASQGMRVGVNLALAIALHNIPEVQIP